MPTITQRTILKALSKGAVIRVEYNNHPVSSVRRIHRLIPGNQLIQEKTVQNMLADRLIRSSGDGLFNDGPAQSYVLFRASEGGA